MSELRRRGGAAVCAASALLGHALRTCARVPRVLNGYAAMSASARVRGPPTAPFAASARAGEAPASAAPRQPGSALGRLSEMSPSALLAVLSSLSNAFEPTPHSPLAVAAARAPADARSTRDGDGDGDGVEEGDADGAAGAHRAHEHPSVCAGRQAARSAAQALFAEATALAARPVGEGAHGWVEALPFGQLWVLARTVAHGRHPTSRVLTVNHARHLMAASQRAVQRAAAERRRRAPRGAPTDDAVTPAAIVSLAHWAVRAASAGAFSQICAPRFFGALAELALDIGVGAFTAQMLATLLHAYARALRVLGGGPDPLAALELSAAGGVGVATGATPTSARPAPALVALHAAHAAGARAAGARCRRLALALHAALASDARVATLSPAHLSKVAWALGVDGLPAQPLLRALAAALPAAAPRMSADGLTNCLWALCCRGYLPREATTALVDALNRKAAACSAEGNAAAGTAGVLEHGHRVQLNACDVALRLEGPWTLRPTPRLDGRLLAPDGCHLGASSGFSGGHDSVGPSSALHLQISETLSSMGTAHVNEATIDSIGCVVDVLVSDSAVVLEVLGESHYAFGGTELRGKTALKLRLLRLEGWLVVEIPYFEWNALGQSARAQREYLASNIVGYVPLWLDLEQ
ncbi:hypothetical protein KFE25_011466 [Diacronema lutheri]|uniref:RAP domain-containing protein n=1 Tax=Diacronema lutheri TaxID=2081491 RepID=A0A8J5X4G1_DIALT|nr:hypothetical protein KFE25_011466 [Diacronema lutheri]